MKMDGVNKYNIYNYIYYKFKCHFLLIGLKTEKTKTVIVICKTVRTTLF